MLDEATAACDVHTDALIQRTIRTVRRSVTEFFLHPPHMRMIPGVFCQHCAHDRTSPQHHHRLVRHFYFTQFLALIHLHVSSDRVLVLAGGQVVEYDTPHALLQTKGSLFASMCQAAGLAK